MHSKLRRTELREERHLEWRSRCLRDAGFPAAEASRIAHDPGYDLHALLELVDRGCRPDLAARILAPLDDGGRL